MNYPDTITRWPGEPSVTGPALAPKRKSEPIHLRHAQRKPAARRDLRAARGILLGVAIGLVLWAAIVATGWALWHLSPLLTRMVE